MEDLEPQIGREIQGKLLPGERPILAQGLYASQLTRFWNLFPRSSIKVILHSDLRDNALGAVNDFLDFIGMDYGAVRRRLALNGARTTLDRPRAVGFRDRRRAPGAQEASTDPDARLARRFERSAESALERLQLSLAR